MQEKVLDVTDVGSFVATVIAATGAIPWIVLIFTIPYFIYRGLYMRQKWLNEKRGTNGQAYPE